MPDNDLLALRSYRRRKIVVILRSIFMGRMSVPRLVTCGLTAVAILVSYFISGPYGRIGAVASLIACTAFLVTFRIRPKESEAAPGAPGSLTESDPHIRVEIIDGRRDLGTPFVLYNGGGGDALDVQICPIRLAAGKATFKNISAILSGGREERVPDIESDGAFDEHDFTALLFHEWRLRNNLTEPYIPVRGTVTYSDLSRTNWFETSFEVVFYPFEEGAPSEWGERAKMVDSAECGTRRLAGSEYKKLF